MSILQLPLPLLSLPWSNSLLINRRRVLRLFPFQGRSALAAIFYISFSLNFISPWRECTAIIYSNSTSLFRPWTDGRFVDFVPEGDLIHNISINSKQSRLLPDAVITIIKRRGISSKYHSRRTCRCIAGSSSWWRKFPPSLRGLRVAGLRGRPVQLRFPRRCGRGLARWR